MGWSLSSLIRATSCLTWRRYQRMGCATTCAKSMCMRGMTSMTMSIHCINTHVHVQDAVHAADIV